ncbi:unnamed protein product [Rotaria sp. Silwood2]|nr:unnamed protein product [Rotaria sp. Silwood2]CAF2994842.1 unnamed protein product [Rotaria sp. Silwood2]CAF3210636.1 unnamed protein product [Rotaria sp. Silwood2]CAF3338191.1 unnamed protein product [Rotaria sp. Silwood2]CAF4264598.1 unnamed protein product [Rotaria sp. Silwood2]
MDDNEFDQVPQILFEDVTSLSKLGTLGTLIPMTNDTRAVLCGDDSKNVVVVATRVGNGRCLVFAHNGYPGIFLTNDTKDKGFVENCRRWLSREEDAQFESINATDSMDKVKKSETILVWNGHNNKSDKFMDDLCIYLKEGGALVCGVTAWGWLQGNKNKLLSDFPFARFCDYIGVKLVDNYASCANPILFRSELVKFKNIYQVVQALASEPNNVENLSIVESAIKKLGGTLPGVPLEPLQNIVLNAGSNVTPVSSCPIKDKSCRQQSISMCTILCALPGIKAPGK